MTNMAFVPKTIVWTPGRLCLPAICLARLVADLAAVNGGLRDNCWIRRHADRPAVMPGDGRTVIVGRPAAT